MVNEILTADKIIRTPSVTDWKAAIRLAAQPLLNDKTITKDYISNMIESLLEYGPYIVLADRFALPHANGENFVSRVGLSLLQVEQEVDLLGKPVNTFLVLATPDNESHIKALAALMELLYEQENLNLLRCGTTEQILNLVKNI